MTDAHLHHTDDPNTSADAVPPAEERAPLKRAILYLLEAAPWPAFSEAAWAEPYTGGLTAFEAQDMYLRHRDEVKHLWPVVQPYSINRRMSELHNAGLIYDTGHRRLSPDGRGAAVWAITKEEV